MPVKFEGESQVVRRRRKREPGLKRQQRKLRQPHSRGMPPAAIEALKRGDFGWKKGQSGNPSGRPKEYRQLVLLARSHTVEAIDTIYSIMMDKKENGTTRAMCGELLLSRGWGKVPASIQVDMSNADRSTTNGGVEQIEAAREKLDAIKRALIPYVGSGLISEDVLVPVDQRDEIDAKGAPRIKLKL